MAYFGKTSNGTHNTLHNNGRIILSQAVLSETATLNKGWFHLKADNATETKHFKVVIYADSAGSPGSLIYTSSEATATTTAGFRSANFAGESLSAGTYWIGAIYDGSATTPVVIYRNNTTNGSKTFANTYASGPPNPPSGLVDFGGPVDCFIEYTGAGGGGGVLGTVEVEAYALAEYLGYDYALELMLTKFSGSIKPLWVEVKADYTYGRVDADPDDFPYGWSSDNQTTFEGGSGKGVLPFVSESLENSGKVFTMMSNSSHRTNWINALVADATAKNWRGISVDIEGFGQWNSTTTNHFYTFITQLSAAMKGAGKITEVYIPPIWNTSADPGASDDWLTVNSSSYYQLTYDALAAITDVDFWEIPLYDYEYDWGAEYPEAPLGWIESTANFAKTKFPAGKIVIGVSSQGHYGPDGWSSFGNWTYAQASAQADFGTATRHSGSHELYWKPSTINYWIADDTTINDRYELLEGLGIQHMSIWYLGNNKYGTHTNDTTLGTFQSFAPKAKVGGSMVAAVPKVKVSGSFVTADAQRKG